MEKRKKHFKIIDFGHFQFGSSFLPPTSPFELSAFFLSLVLSRVQSNLIPTAVGQKSLIIHCAKWFCSILIWNAFCLHFGDDVRVILFYSNWNRGAGERKQSSFWRWHWGPVPKILWVRDEKMWGPVGAIYVQQIQHFVFSLSPIAAASASIQKHAHNCMSSFSGRRNSCRGTALISLAKNDEK